MAYFEKDLEGNFQYSYYGVNGIILGDYVNPEGIEAYIDDEMFYEAGMCFCGKRVLVLIVQKQLQHFSCIHRIGFPFVPILFFGNLGIQDRAIRSDVLPLLFPNFVQNIPFAVALGVVENIKFYWMSLSLRFG